MTIYIEPTHTLYTDHNFPQLVYRTKLYRSLDVETLTVKTLSDFATEMGMDDVIELQPSVYLIDGKVIRYNKNGTIVTYNQLYTYYQAKRHRNKSAFKKLPEGLPKLRYAKLQQETKRTTEIIIRTKPIKENSPNAFSRNSMMPKVSYELVDNTKGSLSMAVSLAQHISRSEMLESTKTKQLARNIIINLLSASGFDQRWLADTVPQVLDDFFTKRSRLKRIYPLEWKCVTDKLSKTQLTELTNGLFEDLAFNELDEYHCVIKTIKTFFYIMGYNEEWIETSLSRHIARTIPIR